MLREMCMKKQQDQTEPSTLAAAQHDQRLVYSFVTAAMDISKPIAFCEHLQLSSLGVQPASISFQVR
jgi:hypothetical protein